MIVKIGVLLLLGELLEIISFFLCIMLSYKIGGFADSTISILQREAFLNKKSAARGIFLKI